MAAPPGARRGAGERQAEGARRAGGERQLAGPAQVPAEIDELFAPSPGPICSWCDFRRHCPEGQAAGPERRPWDGLAE
ncbi:hypothetical protein GCM10022224_053910 [Nonomuraea antimicrobica]|uniref:PD-(D/E)XK nuclease superfamily protein n=1 Tax=Nonomuraea antimicrobica TaxID=561173 RepID=A0ABP7C870_9ACTN